MMKAKKPSRIALLEEKVAGLEKKIKELVILGKVLSVDDTEEEKRRRALHEKGAVIYGE